MFLDSPMPSGSGVSEETLAAMRREFEFWYPWDLRVRVAVPLFHGLRGSFLKLACVRWTPSKPHPCLTCSPLLVSVTPAA